MIKITHSKFILKYMNEIDLHSYMADFVYEHIPGVRRQGNKLNFRCPICGDGKKLNSRRGWYYIDTASYYCWNAGCPANESGMPGFKFLSAISGKPIKEIKLELVKRANSLQECGFTEKKFDLFNEESKRNKVSIADKMDFGVWTEDLPDKCKQYIEDRKLLKAPFIPKNFKFLWDLESERLVIPWGNDYYQERAILSSQKDEPKYKFPSDTEKPIFGLDNLDPSFKCIFLLEGVLDAIWVKNGVAVGSLNISAHQRDILEKYKEEYKIIWMPDNQFADESSFLMTQKICKKNPNIDVFVWPKALKKFKDVNESIIYSDKFIDIWKNETFLSKCIKNGLSAMLMLSK